MALSGLIVRQMPMFRQCLSVPAGLHRRHGAFVMDRIFYSINETARLLGVGRTSVYAMLSDHRLAAKKLGRRTLVTAESIRRLVESLG
jgi:excisionase family DNA binding protein